MLGISGIKQKFHFEFLVGPSLFEAKQDLYASVHTYARVFFEIKFRVGIFFNERKYD